MAFLQYDRKTSIVSKVGNAAQIVVVMASKKKCLQRIKGPLSGCRELRTLRFPLQEEGGGGGGGDAGHVVGRRWQQTCVFENATYECCVCGATRPSRDMKSIHLSSGALLVCKKRVGCQKENDAVET